jgi:death-on-curing protein
VTDYLFVSMPSVLALHDWQLAEYGGLDGVRDMGAIESALARPPNLHAYEGAEIGVLAANYAFGLAKNHGFVDGNKRSAWVTSRLFLKKNLHDLKHDRVDAFRMMESLANGSASETAVVEWFTARVTAN